MPPEGDLKINITINNTRYEYCASALCVDSRAGPMAQRNKICMRSEITLFLSYGETQLLGPNFKFCSLSLFFFNAKNRKRNKKKWPQFFFFCRFFVVLLLHIVSLYHRAIVLVLKKYMFRALPGRRKKRSTICAQKLYFRCKNRTKRGY